MGLDWDMVGPMLESRKHRLGKAAGLGPEQQKHTPEVGHLPERMFSVFGKDNNLILLGPHAGLPLSKIVPDMKRDLVPIIETGAFHPAVIQGKTQGSDQVQHGPCTQARPADVAGIPVHFRCHQDDMTFGMS